jgi:hypothetical protein
LLVEGVLARDKAHVYTGVRWKRAWGGLEGREPIQYCGRIRRKGLKRSGWPGK